MTGELVAISWIAGGLLAIWAAVYENRISVTVAWVVLSGLVFISYGLYVLAFNPAEFVQSAKLTLFVVLVPFVMLVQAAVRRRRS